MSRKNDDENPEFRLLPTKPPIPRERRSSPALSVAFKTVMKYARSSRAGRRQQTARARPAHFQQCAVRVSYSSNRVTGQWYAHGRYVARERASLEPEKSGFCAEAIGVDIASRLREWQDGSDPRMWKLIISPELGERLDLQRLTRDLMNRMASDLHTSLDWVAVPHFNTEHPHVTLRSEASMPTASHSNWIGTTSEMVSGPWRNISRPYNLATGQSRTLLLRSVGRCHYSASHRWTG